MKHVLLASTSPRRKELLESIGLIFDVVPAKYEEDMTNQTDPVQTVKTFSYEKAASLAEEYKDSIIIAADTIVYLEGKVYGKPQSQEEAIRMLSELSGKTHVVYTGFTVMHPLINKTITEVVQTEIKLAELNENAIKTYFKKVPPLDKAGAYAIQGMGATFTEHIKGEYTNVVGLPLYRLTEVLKDFGISLLENNS